MSNEWYTPSKYIEAAREVMGTIDLDPASCALANATVQATTYYTKEQDGLSLPWHGNVWLNPPYGKIYGNVSLMKLFITKLKEQLLADNVKEAIVVSTCDCDEKWFQLLWEGPICFSNHAVWFNLSDGTKSKQFFGTVFTYFGTNEQKFRDVFSQFGHVVMPERVLVS